MFLSPVEFAAFLAVGVVGGITQSMIGIGVSLLAVPAIVISAAHLGLPVEDAPAIGVATAVLAACIGLIVASISHARSGSVIWPIFRRMAVPAVLGMLTASLIVSSLPALPLRIFMSAIIAWVGLSMLMGDRMRLIPSETHLPQSPVAFAIGIGGGLIGAGGALFLLPYLARSGIPMYRAGATAIFISIPTTLTASLYYLLAAPPIDDPRLVGYIFLPAMMGLGIGSMIVAPFGARLARLIPEIYMRRGVGMVLLAIAARTILG